MPGIKGFVPPGWEVRTEGKILGVALAGSIFYSMQFLVRFEEAYSALFVWKAGVKVLREGAAMRGLWELLEGCFTGFWAALLVPAVLVVSHFYSYYQGSRSIYLVRRLPDRWFLLRSCFLLPVLGAAALLAALGAVFLIYRGIYYGITPAECLRL